MIVAERPKVRYRGRPPRSLAAMLDEVLKRSAADLTEEEAVHDLRVACRRLEAGVRVNEGVLRKSTLREVRDAAKVIRRAFDQARDLEVIAAELAFVDGLSAGFRAAVEAAAGEHATGARRRGKVDDAIKTLTEARAGVSADDLPARAVLAATLREHIGALFDELDRIEPDSTDDALHEARIDVKKLRYEMEIGAPAFARLRPQVKRLKRLQDILGRHQDASVGLVWAEQLSDGAFDAQTGDRAALMRYYGALRRSQRSRLRQLLQGWRKRDMRGRFLRAVGGGARAQPADAASPQP